MTAVDDPAPSRPRVLLVRGRDLNRFEMQPYEWLAGGGYPLVAVGSRSSTHQQDGLDLPVVRLRLGSDLVAPDLLTRRLRRRPRLAYPLDRLLGLEGLAEECDILHAAETFLPISEQCARSRSRDDQRLVLTCWENIPFLHDDDPLLARRKAFVQARTDLFLAVTPEAAAALVIEGVDAERVRVIPAGVSAARFRDADPGDLRSRLGVDEDELMVLYLGRLIREKGLVELVRAFAAATSGPPRPRARLVMIGTGPEEHRIRRAAARLGVDGRMVIHGAVSYDEVPAAHAAADIFVLPSLAAPYWEEQFGMVLAEALMSATPVLTTTSGSIPSVVGDAAVVVPSGDVAAMADALRELLLDPERRSRLATKARARSEQFDARAVADQLRDAYRTALGMTPRHPTTRSTTSPLASVNRRWAERADNARVATRGPGP